MALRELGIELDKEQQQSDWAAPVLSEALYSRFASRGLDDFADKVLSAMRKQFGGHAEKSE